MPDLREGRASRVDASFKVEPTTLRPASDAAGRP